VTQEILTAGLSSPHSRVPAGKKREGKMEKKLFYEKNIRMPCHAVFAFFDEKIV
jgi:hypothetical protein